jgi:oligopeptide transport system ATP-binding protein
MTSHTTEKPLLEIRNLKKYYPVTSGIFSQRIGDVKAVDDVSFQINAGEILGLVGESGCGKSTLGRTILRLDEPTSGEILFSGINIARLDKRGLRELRKDMQIIFQDPEASLDPRMSVGDSIAEGFIIHNVGNEKERAERITELMKQVGLEAEQTELYPHEFSGGQKQRIGIARALAINPRLIIADEPVSALDVSIQAQILNLMLDIQQKFGLTYIFIAHDLSVIKYISHRVAVMYLGKIVELAEKKEFFQNPLHPYTEALLSAVPSLQSGKKERILLHGDVPSPIAPPPGCRFHTRCHKVISICSTIEPELKEITLGHQVSCHLYGYAN